MDSYVRSTVGYINDPVLAYRPTASSRGPIVYRFPLNGHVVSVVQEKINL